jgi:type IV pilus assembly protein PilQ
MNRHSPLFRVAFFSLLMAVSLPLLVFAAAQVRHRQLQSKANPRWAGFKSVNGSRPADTGLPSPSGSSPALPVTTASRKKPAPETLTGESLNETRRIPTQTVSQFRGLTGSAQGNLELEAGSATAPSQDNSTATSKPTPVTVQKSTPVPTPVQRARPVQETERRPVPVPERLSPVQTAELERTPGIREASRVNTPVPTPDDLDGFDDPAPAPTPAIPSRPRLASKPKVEFRTLESPPKSRSDSSAKTETDSSDRIEARLAGLQRRLDMLAQAQVDKQMSDLDRTLEMLQRAQQAQQNLQNNPNQGQAQVQGQPARAYDADSGPAPGFNAGPSPSPRGTPTPPEPQLFPESGKPVRSGNQTRPAPGREPSIRIFQGDAGVDDERFSIQVQEANLSEVLDMLGQLAGVNILSSPDVQGRVSLNLQDVTVDRALDAILKSQGFVHERDGDIIYVRSAAEDAAIKKANRKLITKVYQLHYVNANEVQKLIDPVLTVGIGRHAVTTPAQAGIAPTPTSAGGDGLSQRDMLLVQDYPDVIAEVDKVIIEIDVPPLQVMIEAKILSVVLSDSMQFGVNFAMLNGAQNSQLLSGNGSTLNGAVGFPATPALVPAAGDFIANTAGLKYGFIQGDVSGFIKALETIADTTLVAAPQLRVLNKQKAEMIIGQRLSYKTLAFNGNQTVENVQFLDAGTKLIFRPFISPDGLVRLEVHPERSRATINESTGLPNSETTEVTTNVMVRDGTTVVLGGLISEEATESIDRVPFLGAIPWVGAAFRNKTELTQRNELIVLITPRIVTEPEAAIEGEKLQFETESRAAQFRDTLSPINRTSLTRAHYDRACMYLEQGNLLKAKQQIDAALLQNKGDLECQRLKLKIDQALRDQQARVWKWPGRSAQRHPVPVPQ